MDNRYNRHNRRKYSLKVHIVLVTKYRKQILKGSIADDVKQTIYDISPYKSTSRVKVSGYEFTRLLPPPKGSGFPPTATERILFMMRLGLFPLTGS